KRTGVVKPVGAPIPPFSETPTDYGATFTAGTNVDVTASSTQTGFTANSLRFNTAGFFTLTLSGTNTLQSGGILVTPSSGFAKTITGGTLNAGGFGDLLFHVYGGGLTINSALAGDNGLTKTGPGTLTLGGTNTNLSGNIFINRGNL